MGNLELARRLIDDVRAAGVREFCVCAGSRNAPLLAVLGELVAQLRGCAVAQSLPPEQPSNRATEQPRLFSFVDERSAAFFALGRVKLHGNPVAVVTTSGTAVAELLPAAIEAYYSGIPLILISADRPARFRGTGAPQSIEQVGLFGVYAETSLESWTRTKPLHLNIEFDEPLLDCHPERSEGPGWAGREERASQPHTPRSLAHARDDMRHSLVIIGGLAPKHRDFVLERVRNAPFYAEPLSGLREHATITAGERMIARGDFDRVIRIGNVPTLRFWRDLDTMDLPVVHYSDLPFPGLTRGEVHPIEALLSIDSAASFPNDAEMRARFEKLLDDEPQSELAMIRALSRELPENTRVYLGNSLPIREWDLAAERKPFEYEANRGANGIDGQLSTFFGWCDPSRDNVCVIGDLTAIYDLGAPWIVPQLGHKRFRIVIINNGGGRIFGRVASLRALDPQLRERILENSHDIRFDHWAAMWNIDVTELRPDAEATERVWQRYDELWS
jgi:2-succinyl-5-enolpyruvyl-6-hydroxy-3-cyclohexene-1-carboxylate synthase